MRGNGGFTLIEVMVAATVLAIAVLGMLSGIAFFTGHTGWNNQRQIAIQAVQSKMAEIEALTLDDLALVVPSYNEDPADDPDGNGTAPGNTFAVAGLTVRQGDLDGFPGEVIVDDTNPDLLDVTVRIEWQSPRGPAEFELQTLLTVK